MMIQMSMIEAWVVRIPKELKEEMKKASKVLDTIRKKLPKIQEGSIAEWIREEREGR